MMLRQVFEIAASAILGRAIFPPVTDFVVEFVAVWIEEHQADGLAAVWREEMGRG